MHSIRKQLNYSYGSAALWAALFTSAAFTLISLLAAFPDYRTPASRFMGSVGQTLLYPGNYAAAIAFKKLFQAQWMADQIGQWVTLFVTLGINWLFYFAIFSFFVWLQRWQDR